MKDDIIIECSRIKWPKCDTEDPDWQMFSQQMQDCLLDRRGNYITWANPTKKEMEDDSGEPLHDDFCASLMLATLASTGYGKEQSYFVAMPSSF